MTGLRWGFLLPLVLPVLAVVGWSLGGAWTFVLPVVVWGVLPVLDWALGDDPANPDPAMVAALDRSPAFRWLLWAYAPVVMGLAVWGASVAAEATMVEFIGLALSVGLVSGGIGIVTAHELGHRRSKVDRFVAHALLASVGYLHFFLEHNKGHHAKVATPDDPATARAGEGFWHFLPRTVVGQFASAWRFDATRTAAYTAVPLAIAAMLYAAWGPWAAAFFALQASYAVLQLELVNYVEHYGLQRRELAPGRYERVGVQHSWNSCSRLGNWMLFNLQRHAHHHVNVLKPYQSLEHVPAAPQLPLGYPAMLQLAAIPPLWRRVMDRRLPGRT